MDVFLSIGSVVDLEPIFGFASRSGSKKRGGEGFGKKMPLPSISLSNLACGNLSAVDSPASTPTTEPLQTQSPSHFSGSAPVYDHGIGRNQLGLQSEGVDVEDGGGGSIRVRLWHDEIGAVVVMTAVELMGGNNTWWITSTRKLAIHPLLHAGDLYPELSIFSRPVHPTMPSSMGNISPSSFSNSNMVAPGILRSTTALSSSMRTRDPSHSTSLPTSPNFSLTSSNWDASTSSVSLRRGLSERVRAREVDGSGMKKGDEEEKMEVLIRREMEEVERLLRYFRRVGEEAVGGGDCHGGDLAKGGLKSLSISSANGLTDGVWKAIALLPHLRHLELKVPCQHPALDTLPLPQITRYTPFFLDQSLAQEVEPIPEDSVSLARGGLFAKSVGDSANVEEGKLQRMFMDLEVLKVENLSAIGTKNLGLHLHHLALLTTCPKLRRLHVSTVFFDQKLCEAVGALGTHGTLQELMIGTSGTKLFNGGLRQMIGSGNGLKRLMMRDVQGRLAKSLWQEMEDCWPESLEELIIELSEVGPHHSWSADHLESVASLPFAQLRVLQIQRTFTPITLLPFSPGFYSPVVEGLAIPKKMPINLVEAIVKGRLAKVMDLSLDWWEASEEVLGRILRGCPALENLRLRIPFTMVKMVSISTTVLTAPKLERLLLGITPAVKTSAFEVGCVGKNKPSTLTALIKYDKAGGMLPDLIATLPDQLQVKVLEADPSIPPIKDIRRCVRKLPNLTEISWIGRGGKGTWHVLHPEGKRMIAPINFYHSAWRYSDLWEDSQSQGPDWNFASVLLDPPRSDVITTPPNHSGDLVGSTTSLAQMSIMSDETSLHTKVQQWSQSGSTSVLEEPSSISDTPSSGVSSSWDEASPVVTARKSGARQSTSGNWLSTEVSNAPEIGRRSRSKDEWRTGHLKGSKSDRKPLGERRRDRRREDDQKSGKRPHRYGYRPNGTLKPEQEPTPTRGGIRDTVPSHSKEWHDPVTPTTPVPSPWKSALLNGKDGNASARFPDREQAGSIWQLAKTQSKKAS